MVVGPGIEVDRIGGGEGGWLAGLEVEGRMGERIKREGKSESKVMTGMGTYTRWGDGGTGGQEGDRGGQGGQGGTGGGAETVSG